MKASASIEPGQAFVIDCDQSRKLVNLLKKHLGCVEISASCSDGIKRPFEDCDRLEEFENSRYCSIRALHFEGHSKEYSAIAHIDFVNQDYRPTWVYLSGPEPTVRALREEVLHVMAGTRPWYSPLAGFTFWHSLFIGPGLLIAGYAFARLVDSLKATGIHTENSASWSIALFVLGAVCVPGPIYGLNVLRNRLFPIGTFAIGHGLKRNETMEWLRRTAAVITVSLFLNALRSIFF